MDVPMGVRARLPKQGNAEPRCTSIIRAIIYDEGGATAALARSLVAAWTQRGWRVGGLVEDQVVRSDRGRCDMILHELVGGERILISEYRGPHARGCRLDTEALLRASTLVQSTLAEIDILILNKFGKIECQGSGLRSLIVDAIDHLLPIVIFVPRRNLDCWQDFAGPLAVQWELADLSNAGEAAGAILGLHRPAGQSAKEDRPPL